MFKLIIKNLWHRRKRNYLLFAELVIVTVLAWIILDPVIVKMYTSQCSPGYDIDRLALVYLNEESQKSPRYDADAATAEAREEAVMRIVDRIADYPEVENVVPVSRWSGFETRGMSINSISVNDSVQVDVTTITIVPGTPFFETFGLKGVAGSPSASELISLTHGWSDVVISESLARALFPDGRATGNYLYKNTPGFEESPDGNDSKVVGVVNDAVSKGYYGRDMIMYRVMTLADVVGGNVSNVMLAVRVKPGVSMGSFIDGFRSYMNEELKSGNVKAYDVSDYVTEAENIKYVFGDTNELRLKLALAIFFLVNLCLGVIGTFYLQTRTRSEDAGVMRSFGATPGFIAREMLGEGWLLTTLAWLVGCLCYMQYALKEGLEVIGGSNSEQLSAFMPDWTDDFALHFTIVSLIIYAILITVVSIGVYIPTRRVSRVNAVDALREE